MAQIKTSRIVQLLRHLDRDWAILGYSAGNTCDWVYNFGERPETFQARVAAGEISTVTQVNEDGTRVLYGRLPPFPIRPMAWPTGDGKLFAQRLEDRLLAA